MDRIVRFFNKGKHDTLIFANILLMGISMVREYETLYYGVMIISVAYVFLAAVVELFITIVFVTRIDIGSINPGHYDVGARYSKWFQIPLIAVFIVVMSGKLNIPPESMKYYIGPSFNIIFMMISYSVRIDLLKQHQTSKLRRKLKLSYNNVFARSINNFFLKRGLSDEVILRHYKMKPISE